MGRRSRVLCIRGLCISLGGCLYTYICMKEYKWNFDENNMSSLSLCDHTA